MFQVGIFIKELKDADLKHVSMTRWRDRWPISGTTTTPGRLILIVRLPTFSSQRLFILNGTPLRHVGNIKSLHRYPVKSMAGEALASAVLGWHGIEGDRRFSFVRGGNLSGVPWLVASKMPGLIRYKAYHANGKDPSSPVVRVRTPEGADVEVESKALLTQIAASFGSEVTLIRVRNGIFDESPLSVISTTTVRAVETETAIALDIRRFRPNILVEPAGDMPVHEDEWTGGTVVFGSGVDAPSVRVTIPDVRCVMVNLDPETAESDPRIHKAIVKSWNNCAGVYASVLRTGMLSVGDPVYLEKNP
jgi:uncharacterized protein YcbX